MPRTTIWPHSSQVKEIDWVIEHVAVDIRVPSVEENGIFRTPPPRLGIIIACPVADEAGIAIINTPGKAKGLEAGIGIQDHGAEFIVIQPLQHGTRSDINHESGAAQMVRDNAIGHTALHHVLRDVAGATATVHKPADEIPAAIEFRHGLQLILVQKALHETAVDGLANAPVLAIDHVTELRAS